MKCPACKMETPSELGYCDFCKEPFRRKAPEPKPAEKVEVPAAVMAKVLEAKLAGAADGGSGGIPPEFASLDAGERIPELPPIARKLAWAFLALIVFWTGVGLIIMMNRARRAPLPIPVMRPPIPPAGSEGGVPQGLPMAPPPPPPDAPTF